MMTVLAVALIFAACNGAAESTPAQDSTAVKADTTVVADTTVKADTAEVAKYFNQGCRGNLLGQDYR